MDRLPIATGAERLDGTSLQASIAALEAMASDLDADIATATDIDALQKIGATQVALRNRAEALVDAQITMLAGAVSITAEQIDAAAQFAKDTIATMKEWKKKIDTLAKVVDFFGVVMTGNGAKILAAAVGLKTVLS